MLDFEHIEHIEHNSQTSKCCYNIYQESLLCSLNHLVWLAELSLQLTCSWFLVCEIWHLLVVRDVLCWLGMKPTPFSQRRRTGAIEGSDVLSDCPASRALGDPLLQETIDIFYVIIYN